MVIGHKQALALIVAALLPSAARADNPALPGWYADPELRAFDGQYWIYPTYSDHDGPPDLTTRFTPEQEKARSAQSVRPSYLYQTFFNAFSSPDLVHWTKHSHVLDVATIAWANKAIWAPSVIEQDGRYYMFFSANDIQSDGEIGGIGLRGHFQTVDIALGPDLDKDFGVLALALEIVLYGAELVQIMGS